MEWWAMLLDFAIGLATGVISGFGIGGGTLLMLYLTGVTGTAQYTAGGINLLYFLFCAPAALVSHIRNRLVDWKTVLVCTLAGLPVSVGAALLSSIIDVSLLRRLFGVLLLYVGIRELFCRKEPDKDADKDIDGDKKHAGEEGRGKNTAAEKKL